MNLGFTIVALLGTLLGAGYVWIFVDLSVSTAQFDIICQLFKIYAVATGYAAIAGEITGNVSQVDRLWSIMPAIYAGYVAYWELGLECPRVNLMAVLTTIWAVRLSYNFGRRGGYSHWLYGEEDYRWEVLRQDPIFKDKPLRWSLFNVLFICGYQMGLVLLQTLPIVFAWSPEGGPTSLTRLDYALGALLSALVAYETIADNQMYAYQTRKYELVKAGAIKLHRTKAKKKLSRDYYEVGFITSGLWALSRHPNYFAEQSIWCIFYMFSVATTGKYINPSILGSILLLTLFQGSAQFSETITAGKYPLYKQYCSAIPCFIPNPFAKRMELTVKASYE